MSADSVWEELITSALLGSDRRPPQPQAEGALGERLEKLKRINHGGTEDAEKKKSKEKKAPASGGDSRVGTDFLLGAAAVVSQYRLAGRRLGQVTPPVVPLCPPEDRPRCSPAAALRLKLMLDRSYKEILPEWLALAAARGKRVPEEVLPDLLDWARGDSPSLEHVLAVIGQRGRWLAVQNARWEDLVLVEARRALQPEAALAEWQTGKRAARQALLRCLRASQPALGLQLIQSTWGEDGAIDRVNFLNILEIGLSLADEPFLETALDDRSKEVRRAVSELLSGLDGSRLVQRHYQRLRALLKWHPGGFLRKALLEVTLPDACDKDMQRDGIEPKRQNKTRGEKGEWLAQMLSAVPPAWWSRDWNASPEEILTVAAQGDWEDTLRESWVSATTTYADAQWAEALLTRYIDEKDLIPVLPPARREAFYLAQLQTGFDYGLELLGEDEGTWSADLTRQVLKAIQSYHAANVATFEYSWRQNFPAIGRHLLPALMAEIGPALASLPGENANWSGVVESLLQIVDFRRQMIEELNQ